MLTVATILNVVVAYFYKTMNSNKGCCYSTKSRTSVRFLLFVGWVGDVAHPGQNLSFYSRMLFYWFLQIQV